MNSYFAIHITLYKQKKIEPIIPFFTYILNLVFFENVQLFLTLEMSFTILLFVFSSK